MFPSSAIRVIQGSDSKLTIIEPPFYAAGIAAVLLVLVGAGVVYALARATRGGPEINRIIVISAIPFLCVAVAFLTAQRVIVLDSAQQKVTLTRSLVGFHWEALNLSLTQVQGAKVVSGMGTHRLALLLQSGKQVALGNYTSVAGYYEAAQVINDFLKSHPPPAGSK
jgi:hypothetical protein